MTAMNDQPMVQTLAQLGIAVFRLARPQVLVCCGPHFSWFKLLISPVADLDNGFLPSEDSPFLVDFLREATDFWQATANETPLSSGPWVEIDADGQTWAFEAKAIAPAGQPLLLIQQLGESYQRQQELLQRSREQLLENERLAWEVSRRTAKIRAREEELANRLLAAAGYRDLETGAHVRRIGMYAEVLARALGWSVLAADEIRMAAPMHDIGKIGIPDRILLKPGRLDEAEFEIMKGHTKFGARILEGSTVPMLQMAYNIAGGHHERWDGRGYPLGIEGEAIPMAARIVAAVDVFDAMVHRRVYKDPICEAETCHYIRTAAGAHFDPAVVAAFFDIFPTIREIKHGVPEEERWD